MMKKSSLLFFFLLLIPLLASCAEKQVYIVYFGEHSGEKVLQEIEDEHNSYLMSVKETEEEAKSSLLYSYKHSINGFAALLTPEQASKLSELEEVVSVSPSHPYKYAMHTTRSWKFSGLEEDEGRTNSFHNKMGGDFLAKAGYGKNVIVAHLDSGVWPESESFNDKGMGPIPNTWKGICQTGPAFDSSHCNRKLIGARFYLKGFENKFGPLNATEDYRSPRDKDGHGTHTASTIAGRTVPNVSAFGGFAGGTASGGAPLARLAIYKVCWAAPGQPKSDGNVCFLEDVLAAIDDAISDGVDVISISIGTSSPVNYVDDGIAIGALHAVKKNIVVSCSAGNSGPAPGTLSNPAPWIITVGASSVDREFIGPLVLGNGMRIEGKTMTPSSLNPNKMYPLANAADLHKPGVSRDLARICQPDTLSPSKARGKIVFCMRGGNVSRIDKGLVVKSVGGAGMILANTPDRVYVPSDLHFLPTTAVTYDNAKRILRYISGTKNPRANLLQGITKLNTKPAPYMADFTSKGPNVVEPNILKPDITAPGLYILAAWTGEDSPTKMPIDHRIVKYNLYSGTSMSCPHVSALAALLKAIHPTWSSAAIRSAIMTTATQKNNLGLPFSDVNGSLADSFSYGSGHFRPAKAADPGLVYDASYTDYLLYLCSVGVKNIDPTFKCPEKPSTAMDLNYPSLAISRLNSTMTVKRTVTNVGKPMSIYRFSSTTPSAFSVKAQPSILSFDHVGQKKSFTITVTARSDKLKISKNAKEEYAFGWYSWSDGPHHVKSPIAVSLA